MHYCLLYLSIYLPECKFEIDATDRYSFKPKHQQPDSTCDKETPHLEGCVVARQLIEKGQPIPHLNGWLAELEDDSDECFPNETDFSIINTGNESNLLLGPARFVNHDCNPNCAFSRKGKQISIRSIKEIHIGQELTVAYAKNYFGSNNKECRCVTCEIGQVNGFAPEATDTDSTTTQQMKTLQKVYNLVLSTDSCDATASELSSRDSSLAAEASSPPTSTEPEIDLAATCRSPGKRSLLKRRYRLRGMMELPPNNKLFDFAFDGDDSLHTLAKKEWKLERRSMPHEERDSYGFLDFIFKKLSKLHMYKEMQRFYLSSPIEADPDLTLDCVNCFSPFYAPDDDVAPRRLPTRLCPRCNRHAVVYNAYWPSMQAEEKPIELFRAWDFTSLNNIGVRGEFDPSTYVEKKTPSSGHSTNSLNDESEASTSGKRPSRKCKNEHENDSSRRRSQRLIAKASFSSHPSPITRRLRKHNSPMADAKGVKKRPDYSTIPRRVTRSLSSRSHPALGLSSESEDDISMQQHEGNKAWPQAVLPAAKSEPIDEDVQFKESSIFSEGSPDAASTTPTPKTRKYKRRQAPFKGFDIKPNEIAYQEQTQLPTLLFQQGQDSTTLEPAAPQYAPSEPVPPVMYSYSASPPWPPPPPPPPPYYNYPPPHSYPPAHSYQTMALPIEHIPPSSLPPPPPPLHYPAPSFGPYDRYGPHVWNPHHPPQPPLPHFPYHQYPVPPPPPPPPPQSSLYDLRYNYELKNPQNPNGYSYPLGP